MRNVPETEANATSDIGTESALSLRAYKTSSLPERRRIQTAVILEYRARVASYVRRKVSARYWEEAEQVGLIGLLVALEKYDASRGLPFWFFAVRYVREELNTWIGEGVFWRRRSHDRKRDAKDPLRALHNVPVSMDAPIDSGGIDTRHDKIAANVETVEDLVATAEGLYRLEMFLRTLTADEAALLVNGVGFGRGRANSARAAGHKSLVERATAFVRGQDEYREPVRGHSDSPRADHAPASRGSAR